MNLSDYPWQEAIPRLLAYAARKVRARYWRGQWNGPLPGGQDLQDLVQEGITKVISGQRRWNPQLHPDLFRFLCGVLDSDISHLATGAENRRQRELSPSFLQPEDATPATSPLPPVHLAETSQGSESALLAKIYFQDFEKSLRDDPELSRYLLLWKHGYTACQIADALGLPLSQVYDLRQKLREREAAFRAGTPGRSRRKG